MIIGTGTIRIIVGRVYNMFWWIIGIVFGVSFLTFIFFWLVLIGLSKAAQQAHEEGWENHFE